MLLTINLPGTSQGQLLEVPGLGVFENGYVHELSQEGKDIVIGVASDDLPVKTEPEPGSDEVKKLMRLTHAELDAKAEQFKVTFDEGMTKEDKVQALLASKQEGED